MEPVSFLLLAKENSTFEKKMSETSVEAIKKCFFLVEVFCYETLF